MSKLVRLPSHPVVPFFHVRGVSDRNAVTWATSGALWPRFGPALNSTRSSSLSGGSTCAYWKVQHFFCMVRPYL